MDRQARVTTVAGWDDALAHGRLEVGLRRGWLALLVAIMVVFVLGSPGIVVGSDSGQELAIGVVALLFFGACCGALLVRLAKSGPALVVSDDGVRCPHDDWFAPWASVTGSFVLRNRWSSFICLSVEPELLDEVMAGRPAFQRAAARWSGDRVGPALTLPRPLAVPGAELFSGWLTDQAVRRSR